MEPEKEKFNPIQLLAGKVVNAVVADMRGRVGLMQGWNKLPKHTKSHIVRQWLELVDAELTKALKVNQDDVVNKCPENENGHRMGTFGKNGEFCCEFCGGS